MNYPVEKKEQNSPNTYPSGGGGSTYCTNCGASVMPNAYACIKCGAAPVGHRKFCHTCGTSLNPEQIICIRCGVMIMKTQSIVQRSSAQAHNNNGSRSQTGSRTILNAQAGNQFSAYGNQPFLPVQNTSPATIPFNEAFKTFWHKLSENNKMLKIGIGIGVFVFFIFVGIVGNGIYQHNLNLEKGRVNRSIAEERHRTNIQILQMNQESAVRQETAQKKLERFKKRMEMEQELMSNRWNMSQSEIDIAQERINRLKQEE